MTKWDVRGASLETGQEIRETIVAADYQGVQAALKARKIAAESIKPAKPDAKVSPLAPRPIMTAKAVAMKTYPLTKVAAIVFLVFGAIAWATAVFAMLSGPNVVADGTVESLARLDAANSIRYVSVEYRAIVGGVAIFAGMALLMLRQIAMNTAARRPE